MAFERTQPTSKAISGDSLDSFVKSISSTYSTQVSVRNADDETNFNKLVLENNLSLDDQLAYRKAQLARVSDDPTEKRRITAEISGLKNRIEAQKFSDAYLDKLMSFQSGASSIDTVIQFLTDQKAITTDVDILNTINQELVKQSQARFNITKDMLENQTQYAINDKTESVLNTQIDRVTSAKSKALLDGNDSLVAMYDLQLQSLTKAKTENSISNDIKNFSVTSLAGYSSASKLLDSYNAKIESSTGTGPITIGGVTYSSAKEFWTYKRDTYLADQSTDGFFHDFAQEMDNKVKMLSSKNSLDVPAITSIQQEYDKLYARPEMAPFTQQIDTYRQNSLQGAADLFADKVVTTYANDYDFNKASQVLNTLKQFNVNIDSSYNKLLVANANVKQGGVSDIISEAYRLMQATPGLTLDQAVQQAVKSGASTVLSPEQLGNQTETDLAAKALKDAEGKQGQNDPRLTAGGATPGSTPSSATPTNSDILLKFGSRGDAVSKLQQSLASAGYNVAVDGIYGAQTQKAVTEYQKTNGLTVDGIAGKQTLGALNALPPASSTTTPPKTPTPTVTTPQQQQNTQPQYQSPKPPTQNPTPTPTPTPKPPSAPASPQYKTYVVQSGDTLSGIAAKMLGSAGKYSTIAQLNGIADANKIKVGQTIKIPI